jgi:uncharacterized membrane protein YebE (DUF533 family)
VTPERLVAGVLGSVFGGRRKRGRRALRYLTRGGSGALMSNPAALLAAAGVAWGVVETLQSRGGPSPAAGSPPLPPPPPPVSPAAPAAETAPVRLVRLAVSAALADGVLTEAERAAVLEQARQAGVAEQFEQERQRRRPLSEIVTGVADPAERVALYVLAFTILRADEQVSGADRIYLAQLAHLLGLDPPTVERLEADTAGRIDSQPDSGGPAGRSTVA